MIKLLSIIRSQMNDSQINAYNLGDNRKITNLISENLNSPADLPLIQTLTGSFQTWREQFGELARL